MMRTVGNIVWLLLAGWELAVGYAVAGTLNVIFIVTIPFGLQAFKLAGYALWPFGRVVVADPEASPTLSTVGNVIWFLTAGWWLALTHVGLGLLLMLTIVGIPFGLASMRMAGLALFPFGKTVVSRTAASSRRVVQAGPEPLRETLQDNLELLDRVRASRSPSVQGLEDGGRRYTLKDDAFPVRLLEDPDVDFHFAIVGESHHQQALRAQMDESTRDRALEAQAILQPQPANPHDKNAVGVVMEGGVVGHFARDEARVWQPRIIEAWEHYGRPVAVPAKIYRGPDGGCGVWLALPDQLIE